MKKEFVNPEVLDYGNLEEITGQCTGGPGVKPKVLGAGDDFCGITSTAND